MTIVFWGHTIACLQQLQTYTKLQGITGKHSCAQEDHHTIFNTVTVFTVTQSKIQLLTLALF